MRREPGKHERHRLALGDRERRVGAEVASLEVDRGVEGNGIGACDADERAIEVAHPGDRRAVVEADRELHLHVDSPPNAVDEADDVRSVLPRWHEVDQSDHARVGLELRLEDERVPAIPAPTRTELARGLDPPLAVLRRPDESREARAGVEPGETEPVDAAVTAYERRALEVADEPVVLDEGHQVSSRSDEVPRNRFPAARENAARYSSAAGSSRVAVYVSRMSRSRS